MAKELFTSVDNYVIGLNEAARAKKNSNLLLLAASLPIDIISNEGKTTGQTVGGSIAPASSSDRFYPLAPAQLFLCIAARFSIP
jgi:hypothetical protein